MKEMMAFLTFVSISSITIYLSVTKQIDWKLTSLLLIFSIASGFCISNYDWIKKFKWGSMEVETAKQEISKFKESALSDIDKEVQSQKESIKLLMSSVNETKDEVYKQKEALSKLIETATALQSKIEEQKNQIIELNESAEKTKKNIEILNSAAKEIALILVRATYLSMETKSEFGTERAQRAIKEVLNDLNRVLPMVIPDPKERSAWVQQLQAILPSRQ